MVTKQKLAQLASNLRQAEAELASATEAAMSEPKLQYFTEELHTNFCKASHEDMCLWKFENDYESRNGNRWTQPTHKQWEEKALRLYMCYPNIDIADIIGLMKTGKTFK